MLSRMIRVVLMIAVMLLAGCGGDSTDQQDEVSHGIQAGTRSESDDAKVSTGIVPQYQLDALDNASDVETLLLKADEERQKLLEQL